MKKAVFGIAKNDEQANRIVEHLISDGFSNEDISIIHPDRTKTKESNQGYNDKNTHFNGADTNTYDETNTHKKIKKGKSYLEENTKAPEGAATGATTGGILGGSLGLLAGIGALAIPGVGPFIAAGPIMAALSGSAVGGSLGLLIGAIVGYGIPEYEAKKYEASLKEGKILISVQTDNNEEIQQAIDIMKEEGATEVSSTKEKTKSHY